MKQGGGDEFSVFGRDAVDRGHAPQAIGKFAMWVDAAFREAGRARGVALEIAGIEIGRHRGIDVAAGFDEAFIGMSLW